MATNTMKGATRSREQREKKRSLLRHKQMVEEKQAQEQKYLQMVKALRHLTILLGKLDIGTEYFVKRPFVLMPAVFPRPRPPYHTEILYGLSPQVASAWVRTYLRRIADKSDPR